MFFSLYQVGYFATRYYNKIKEKANFFPALWSEMITMKPRFIYKNQKFISTIILKPKSKVSFENSCED